MQKLDVIVAVAGGVILLVAVVGATLSGGGTLAFDAVYGVKDVSAKAPLVLPTPATGTVRTSATLPIAEPNLMSVEARVAVTATPGFPSGATAHLKLTSPTGNVTEKDLTAAAGASSMSGALLVTLSSAPANGTIQAANADAAAREAWSHNSTLGMGNWTLEVSYAPGPVPPPQASGELTWAWKSWEPVVTTAAPASR